MVVKEDCFIMVNKIKFEVNRRCNINDTKDFVSIIKLPNYPLTEQFGKYEKNFPSYNQELVISKSSGHVQLKYILDQKYLYSSKNYHYKTKISYSTKDALGTFIKFFKKNHKKKIKNILDVGGNDGYLVNKLANKKTNKYILDPVATVKNDGVKVINKFLDDVNIGKDIIKPDVVICRHTLEHIPDPKNFLKKLLFECSENCNFIFEVPSLERMIKTQRFDAIMHQHVNYFSIESLKLILSKCGGIMTDYSIFNEGSCGGSIIFSFKKSKGKIKIKDYKKNYNYKKNYILLKESIKIFKKNMIVLNKLINSADKVVGYGGGLMLATYLYFLKIKHNKIKYILDDDPNKHNLGYKNIKINIKYSKKKAISNCSYLITSLENKKILIKKISALNYERIFYPY
jgi:2-polyprenyl-3-methyl-5-hydroxy-6-metoxy-1,4-benzoquinol methylase